jgi:molybdopterin-guanine dinucleotide biosynthesis protein A
MMPSVLQADRRRVSSWLPEVIVRYTTSVEIIRFDPLTMAFRNLNTPQDLAQAQNLAPTLNKEKLSQ